MPDTQVLKDLAVSESGFVFDPHTGSTFTLNETGKAVLEGLREGCDLEELAELLDDRFEVGSADVRRDLYEFLRLLRQHGLVGSGHEL